MSSNRSLFGYTGSVTERRAFDLCILDEMEQEKREPSHKAVEEKAGRQSIVAEMPVGQRDIEVELNQIRAARCAARHIRK